MYMNLNIVFTSRLQLTWPLCPHNVNVTKKYAMLRCFRLMFPLLWANPLKCWGKRFNLYRAAKFVSKQASCCIGGCVISMFVKQSLSVVELVILVVVVEVMVVRDRERYREKGTEREKEEREAQTAGGLISHSKWAVVLYLEPENDLSLLSRTGDNSERAPQR